MKQQEATNASLREEFEAEQARVRRANAVTPEVVSGPPDLVTDLLNKRSRVNLDKVALKEKEEHLAKLEAELEALKKQRTDQTTIFAMLTGQKYANLEVMDCGRQQQP